MQDDEFEWDDDNARTNLAKHDVSFEVARAAFADPDWEDFDDPDPDEERFKRYCAYEGVIYVVTYCERGLRTRIISARKADKHERRIYLER